MSISVINSVRGGISGGDWFHLLLLLCRRFQNYDGEFEAEYTEKNVSEGRELMPLDNISSFAI